jgi:hypothetical protein
MSLKSYIAQIEAQQLNEFAPTAPSSTSTATAPSVGQKVLVKPGQPQEQDKPQATVTNQAGKIIAQADADDAKKLGDLVNTGDITLMDPMTGKPLEEESENKPTSQAYRDAMAAHDSAGRENRLGQAKDRLAHRAAQPKTLGQKIKKDIGEPLMKLARGDIKGALSENIMTASKLDDILKSYPHEHKMAQDGWGIDRGLLAALTDHYFKDGRIPRSVWDGPSEELHKHVEECYAQDTGIVMDEGIEDRIGAQPQPIDTNPATQNPVTTPAYVRKQQQQGMKPSAAPVQEDELEEMSELERMLKQPTEESTMYESKKLKGDQAKLDANKNGKLEKSDFEALRAKKVEEATEKTKTGLKHTADAGGYGRKHEDDEDEDGKKVKADDSKKGRGRPKKDSDESGEVKKYDTKTLGDVFGGGKKPKKEVGKLTHKHRIKTKADSEEVDESISKWDAQLKTLLEGKQVVKEGLSVSTSVGQEGAPDSVSITASDEDAHQLLALLNNAGMGSGVPGHAVKSNPVEELLKAHGSSDAGGSFSTAGTEEPSDVEVTDFDGAQDEISGGEDDGMDAMKKMLAAMGIGKEAAPEPKHPDIAAGSDSEEAPDEEGEEKEEIVGEEEKDENDSGNDSSNEPEDHMASDTSSDDEDDSEEEKIDEDEVEEGNFFTGNLAKAREEGRTEADLDGDGDMEKVKEGAETQCNECGAMYEGDDHTCSHVEESQLNEWANSPQGQSEDEEFTATIEYFTKAISGGLNGQKKDQTVMPHTSVKVSEGYTINVADEMRKLAGIK